MRVLVLFLVFVSILQLACQKKVEMDQYRWSIHSEASKETTPESPSPLFRNADVTVKVFDEIVERSAQKVAGAVVDSSYLQKVSNSRGQIKYLAAQYQSQDLMPLKEKAEELRTLRFAALQAMKRKVIELRTAAHVFDPEVVISGGPHRPRLQYQIDYIPRDRSGAYSMRVSPNLAVESVKRVEHCYQESRSLVFPVGPRLSDLMETMLKPLVGDGSLTSPRIYITSTDGVRVKAEEGAFLFGPEDPRFDHVQAFFFAQKTLNYAEKNWDLSLPFPIKINLRAGYPEKTNWAYYYRGFVGLGDGDGVSYRHIPRDPSIVTHEVAHALIDALSGMASEGETASLNEGFADYLTASLWENPELGHTAFMKRSFTRTVNTSLTYGKRNGGLYHDSGLLSGTFWDIEKRLGSAKAQKLAIKTIVRLGSEPLFVDVFGAVVDASLAAGLTGEERSQVLSVLQERGWPEKKN